MKRPLHRLVLLGVIASVTTRSVPVQALECSSTCGKPTGLEFCSHVSFAVCNSDIPWTELDASAMVAYSQWTNASETLLAELPQYQFKDPVAMQTVINRLDLVNTSSSCGLFLKRLQCAVHLPACEIGRDYSHLCMASCQTNAKKLCPGLVNICEQLPAGQLETKGKCFKFDYKGPAVGMWVAGFAISLVFSILNSVGINLQKLSMARNETAESKKSTFGQPLWVLGFALVILGSLLDFVAFGMAPQTLLAPLAALSLVWNMFIAPIFHKEKVTRSNIVATVIIFAGVTLTVIFAGHSTPEYELDDLIRLYKQPAMYAYMLIIATFLSGLLYFASYIERTHHYEGGIYHIICYGGVAGTFGGQSVLLAKSTVELLKSAIWGQSGSYMFTQPASYVIVMALAMCLVCQVHFLNGGLARFDALVVIPVYQSFWILMSVLGGIMYFAEYVNMTPMQLFMFSVGGVVTILGIVVLLRTRSESSKSYIELTVTPSSAWTVDDSDEEEIIQLKTHNKLLGDDDDIKVSPMRGTFCSSPPTSESSGASVCSPIRVEKSKKVGNGSDTCRTSNSKPKSPTYGSPRTAPSSDDGDDEDSFL